MIAFPWRFLRLSCCILIGINGFFDGKMNAEVQSSLLTHSPFLPPDYRKQSDKPRDPVQRPSAVPNRLQSEVEFRGMFKMDGEWQFSIFDVQKQKSSWLRVNEHFGGIKLTHYSPEEQSVTVLRDGMNAVIKLKESSKKAAPVAAAVTAPSATVPAQINPRRNTTRVISRTRPRSRRRRIIPPSSRQQKVEEVKRETGTPAQSAIPPSILEQIQKENL